MLKIMNSQSNILMGELDTLGFGEEDWNEYDTFKTRNVHLSIGF